MQVSRLVCQVCEPEESGLVQELLFMVGSVTQPVRWFARRWFNFAV